ncbi:DUF2637 domain-containing protein [Nocardia fluminea]|uniref:DUF2637 domain-containing protein n=1 Tax=Nocardia fluminea TaxID=134984 RepID=UPI0036502ADE
MSTVRPAAVQPVKRSSTGGMDWAEGTALAMTVVIALGAFAWSFAALSDLAVMAGIDSRLAWIGPIFVDGAIVQSAVALVSLQRRAQQGITIPIATKVFFWAELFAAELISVVGNGFHAAESDQLKIPGIVAAVVAGAAPLAGLAATHGLTALIEVPRTPPSSVDGSATGLDGRSAAVDAEWTALDDDRTALDGGSTTALAALDSAPAQDPLAERDAEIRRRHAAGESYREIADAVGLSKARVGQILASTEPVDTGAEVLTLIR